MNRLLYPAAPQQTNAMLVAAPADAQVNRMLAAHTPAIEVPPWDRTTPSLRRDREEDRFRQLFETPSPFPVDIPDFAPPTREEIQRMREIIRQRKRDGTPMDDIMHELWRPKE